MNQTHGLTHKTPPRAELPADEPTVSVCIVSAERPHQLRAVLSDLALQHNAPSFEILVANNGDEETAQIVRITGHPVRLIETARRHRGTARAPLLLAARGSLLVFLDDDVRVPARFLADLELLAHAHPGVGVFGGPNLSPPDSSPMQIAQGLVLGNPHVTGPVHRRYRKTKTREARIADLCLCNLAVRRCTGLTFDTELEGGEEHLLLHRLRESGVAMISDPRLAVSHQRRPTYRAYASQIRRYAAGTRVASHPSLRTPNRSTTVGAPSTRLPAHAIGAALAPAALGTLGATRPTEATLVILAYVVTIALATVRALISTRSLRIAVHVAVLIPLTHTAYTIGYHLAFRRPTPTPETVERTAPVTTVRDTLRTEAA